jgi:hypothetical protein
MKVFLLGMVTTLFLLLVGAYGYLSFGLVDLRGDVPASRVESSLLQMAVRASVRRNAPQFRL